MRFLRDEPGQEARRVGDERAHDLDVYSTTSHRRVVGLRIEAGGIVIVEVAPVGALQE